MLRELLSCRAHRRLADRMAMDARAAALEARSDTAACRASGIVGGVQGTAYALLPSARHGAGGAIPHAVRMAAPWVRRCLAHASE